MITFTAWLDRVGDNVSRQIEAETGDVTLTFFKEAQENKLRQIWRTGNVPPKYAAQVYLSGALD
jgi:hypothetical protein